MRISKIASTAFAVLLAVLMFIGFLGIMWTSYREAEDAAIGARQ